MSSRTLRTEIELRGASDHLHYEVGMLFGTAQLLASGGLGDSILSNAVLESFTVHTRVLLDFLYDQDPRADDVVAADFFDAPEHWETLRPPMIATLSRVDWRVGKEVAHLTYARQEVTPEVKDWPYVEIANDIKKVINRFLANAPKARLGSRWNDAAS